MTKKTKTKQFTEDELKNSKRIYKSATPKYTVDWYIKWVASIFIVSAMSLRGIEGLQFYDLILSIMGVSGWIVVSILGKDRALTLLNSVGLLFLMRNFFAYVS